MGSPPGSWLAAHMADLTLDLHTSLSEGSTSLSFHSRRSLSVDSTNPLLPINPKLQASNHLLWPYSGVCVGRGLKPQRHVFSRHGPNVMLVLCTDGRELSEEEIHALTSPLSTHHAVAVRKRVDTLNATLRKKQKYTTKIDVRNIFPQQTSTLSHQNQNSTLSHQGPVQTEERHIPTRQVSMDRLIVNTTPTLPL